MSWLWLVLALGGGEVLEDERYRFCHDPEFPLYEDERRWCEIVSEDTRCEELPEACRAANRPDAEPPEAEEEESESPVPPGMSALAQIVLFGLAGAGLVALLLLLWRSRVDGGEREPAEEPSDEPQPPVDDAAAARTVLTDVDRLLAEARSAEAAGQHDRAIELAYAAGLRRLESDGLIDMDPARTNGDYVRRLRDHPQLQRPMREIVRDVEGVQFGAKPASAEMFSRVMDRVTSLLAGAGSVLLWLSLLGCSGGPPKGEAIGGGGEEPTGARAVAEVVDEAGHDVGFRARSLAQVGEQTSVLVVLPGGEPEDGDWSGVISWVEEGGTLVLAGVEPQHDRLRLSPRGWAGRGTKVVGAGSWRHELSGLDIRVPAGRALDERIGPATASPVLVRVADPDRAYAVEAPLGHGWVLAFADGALLTNIAMAARDNPDAVRALLEPVRPGTVDFCTDLTGAGAETPMESVHRAKLTPFLLQAVALLSLILLYRGRAFGRLREPKTHQRRAFADHVRAVGLQYARAGATGRALGVYGAWALDQLSERLPRGRQRELEDIAAEAAERSGDDPAEIAALLRVARGASETEGPASLARPDSPHAHHVPADETQRIETLRRLARLLSTIRHGRSPEAPWKSND